MTDQLNGQWYANLCQLGYIVDENKVKLALKSIFRYNVKEDEGLINATYPSGERPSFQGDMKYPNGTNIVWRVGSQPDTPWTGTEYATASLMIQEGLVEEGLRVLRTVYERYAKYGMFWNHIECGGHYYRAMDVWAVLMALEGFSFKAPGILSFDPKITPENFRGAFAVKGVWGTYSQEVKDNSQKSSIKLEFGSLEIHEVSLPVLVKKDKLVLKLLVNDRPLKLR